MKLTPSSGMYITAHRSLQPKACLFYVAKNFTVMPLTPLNQRTDRQLCFGEEETTLRCGKEFSTGRCEEKKKLVYKVTVMMGSHIP